MTELTKILNYPTIRHTLLSDHSSDMIDNIQDVLSVATSADIQNGLNWYQNAHDYAKQLASDNLIPLESAAGIIAALSPNCYWDQNKIDAKKLIADPYYRCSTYGNQVKKAQSILFGEDPYYVLGRTRIAKKEYSFFQNILDPTQDKIVTLDLWGHRVLIGDATIHRDKLVRLSNTAAKYSVCADIYNAIASDIGVIANQLQSITWVVLNRVYGKNRS